MSFSVEFHPSKEEIFKKSDEECQKQADQFKISGGIFTDPGFPPNSKSLGAMKDKDTGKVEVENSKDPWLQPHQFNDEEEYRINCEMPWHVWEDPWPFHACQGLSGDCWLIASLMTIARRKELLEQVVPRREYTMECGIVQVRLCINGVWKVIKIDYHLPQIEGRERCAGMVNRQLWVAFIEKAFAKHLGNYGKLHGGSPDDAMEMLTGSFTRKIHLDMFIDKDELWERMIKNYTAGFLMVAGTPILKEKRDTVEIEFFEKNGMHRSHGYSILDFREYNGDRLIQIGNTNMVRWNGKWTLFPNYPHEVYSQFSFMDIYHSSNKIFWMSIDDFLRFFRSLYVCEYREGWNEKRFTQKISRWSGNDTQILQIHVREPCELVFDVHKRNRDYDKCNIFLNIHQSSPEILCGELISSSHNRTYYPRVASEPIRFQPGTYSIVVAFPDTSIKWMDLNWVIKSPNPLDRFSIVFPTCPISTVNTSLHQAIAKYGTAEISENVVVYTWKLGISLFVMVENQWKWEYIRVNEIVSSLDGIDIHKHSGLLYSVPVPPKSRRIVGVFSVRDGGLFGTDTSVKFKVRWKIWKFLDWLDHFLLKCDMNVSIGLTDWEEITVRVLE